MSWYSKIAGLFSRKKAEQTVRSWGYDAGSWDRINQGWRVPLESAETTARYNRDTIRARARDLERNSDISNSIINAYKRNVVGDGFKLQARTPKAGFNAEVEALWNKWTKARNCDVTGQQSFNQMLRMAIARKKIDGGIIFKKCFTAGGIVPFKLQLLEVDELDGSHYTPHDPLNKVVDGVEYNEYNRPIGYWIRQYSLDGYQELEPVYVEAKDIIFYWQKTRPSQVREISDMAPTITRIRDVNEFINAISVKERIAACLSAFITKSTPVVSGMGRGIGGAPAVQNKSYDGKRISPGMIMELNVGEDVKSVSPSGSGNESSAYLKTQHSIMAAGQGISYEALTRDMSQTNYSSARQGLIEDELKFAEEIELLQENVMDEIYETFVQSAILSGALKSPASFWTKLDDWLKHDWVASPKKWIDPQKEASANQIALATGQKTLKDICAERGKDVEDVLQEIADIRDMAMALNLNLEGGNIFGITSKTEPTEPTEPAEPSEDGEPVQGSED